MPAFPPLLLSTDDLPAGERFEAWREAFGMRIARVEVGTANPAGFRANIHVQPLPSLIVSLTGVAPCSLTRTPALLRDDDDSLVFVLCLAGYAEMRFGNDRARLPAGTSTLVSNHRRGGYHSDADATTCSLRIDRQTVRSFAPAFDGMLLRESRPGDPSLAILAAYLKALLASHETLSPATVALADSQIRELLAHILNPAGDLARAAPYGGVRVARLRAILNDIAAHLEDPSLNAAAVGARLGVSARYVQQLFDSVGHSFSDHVRDLRLDLARRMLADPRYAHLRIIDICAMAGFNDLSHFNRRFRTRFGETPGEARRP